MKFSATKLGDLLTREARIGRAARVAYDAVNNTALVAVVHVEADDGSWCELDAESVEHAKALANNWVHKMNARGASCRMLRGGSPGSVALKPFYTVYAELTVSDDEPTS